MNSITVMVFVAIFVCILQTILGSGSGEEFAENPPLNIGDIPNYDEILLPPDAAAPL